MSYVAIFLVLFPCVDGFIRFYARLFKRILSFFGRCFSHDKNFDSGVIVQSNEETAKYTEERLNAE